MIDPRMVHGAPLVLALAIAPLACVGTSEGDHDSPATEIESDEADVTGTTSSALVDSDPVSQAVNESCTTASVKGLATQLVEEIQCLRPNTLKKIDGIQGLNLGAAVFPYLQTPAADALVQAQKARGVAMQINSGLRTLPQQYLLYRWYRTGRCGIRLAASPGTSNHESAVAIDINDNAAWRTALQGKNFRWLGASDPVHYDFIGGGTVSLRGLSVQAYQRLWNRNHPEDKIAEDGAYGAQTENRLAKSPVGGFPIGAKCDEPKPPPPPPGEPPAVEPVPEDGPEPDEGLENTRARGTLDTGCAAGGSSSPGNAALAFGAAALVLAVRRRRRS